MKIDLWSDKGFLEVWNRGFMGVKMGLSKSMTGKSESIFEHKISYKK